MVSASFAGGHHRCLRARRVQDDFTGRCARKQAGPWGGCPGPPGPGSSARTTTASSSSTSRIKTRPVPSGADLARCFARFEYFE